MKKKIIFGSILAVFIMMMLPLASATESKAAIKSNKLRMYLDKFKGEIGNDPPEPTIILRLLLWLKNIILVICIGIILLLLGGSSNSSSTFI